MRKLLMLCLLAFAACSTRNTCTCTLIDKKGNTDQSITAFSKYGKYERDKNECYEYQIKSGSKYIQGNDTFNMTCNLFSNQ